MIELDRTKCGQADEDNFSNEISRGCPWKLSERLLSPPICYLQVSSGPQSLLLIRFVIQMVASAFEFTTQDLFRERRESAKLVRARQVTIYLLHTSLRRPFGELAEIFDKDRSTIGHACRVIEDLRDIPKFDDRIIELEQTIQTVLNLTFKPDVGGSNNG